ncbi:hypothetical protein F5I97DRAFT_1930848 [Phlebopus sp. FC_14]|nr:hypothetical protein F5I97DRAFT_1930848 [Phlebopus sp. FC_14]
MTWILVEWGSSVLQPSQPASLTALLSLPQPSRPASSPFRIDIWEPLAPTKTERAVTQFLLDQIQHATQLASLSVGVGAPLLTLFEEHQNNVERLIMQRRVHGQHLQTGRTFDSPLTNLSRLLQAPLIDFTASGFIGKTFSHALDELDHLGSWSVQDRGPALKEHREARSRAIFWRTSSNLLLEYSSARPRAKDLLLALRAAQQHLLPILWAVNAESRVWWRGIPHATSEESLRDLSAGLEVAIENLQQLVAYLDWITDHLVRIGLNHLVDFALK